MIPFVKHVLVCNSFLNQMEQKAPSDMEVQMCNDLVILICFFNMIAHCATVSKPSRAVYTE